MKYTVARNVVRMDVLGVDEGVTLKTAAVMNRRAAPKYRIAHPMTRQQIE
jgi:hypothetical protein